MTITAGDIPETLLERDASVIFALDADLRLVYCNRAWDCFAAANGGEKLLRPALIGHSLMEFISAPLARFYESAYRNVLLTGEPWSHVYECSSAWKFRKFAMQVLRRKQEGGLLVINSLCVEWPHEQAGSPGVDAVYRKANGMIVMCCHCRRTERVDQPGLWDWVADYVERMPRQTSHSLCGTCLEYFYPDGD